MDNEKRIRDMIGRVTQDSGISEEYNILNIRDTKFLLDRIDMFKEELRVFIESKDNYEKAIESLQASNGR